MTWHLATQYGATPDKFLTLQPTIRPFVCVKQDPTLSTQADRLRARLVSDQDTNKNTQSCKQLCGDNIFDMSRKPC